ncbi:hypothetical protein GH733_019070 [Mirounga leonina]|nr:hypothetical protein GH733_019070 [Mirounga leonina]
MVPSRLYSTSCGPRVRCNNDSMLKLEGQGSGSMKHFDSQLLRDTSVGRGQAQPIAGTPWTQVQQIRKTPESEKPEPVHRKEYYEDNLPLEKCFEILERGILFDDCMKYCHDYLRKGIHRNSGVHVSLNLNFTSTSVTKFTVKARAHLSQNNSKSSTSALALTWELIMRGHNKELQVSQDNCSMPSSGSWLSSEKVELSGLLGIMGPKPQQEDEDVEGNRTPQGHWLLAGWPEFVTESQVWLLLTQKVNTQETGNTLQSFPVAGIPLELQKATSTTTALASVSCMRSDESAKSQDEERPSTFKAPLSIKSSH